MFPPPHPFPRTHTISIGSTLDAKVKMHESKHPHEFKYHHVPSKINDEEKKNLIHNPNQIRRPQRSTKEKIKTMWIPKKKDTMPSNEKYIMASIVVHPHP